MDNPRLFTGSIRNHPAGIAPDSLIRLSPSPYRKIRAEFYVKTPLGSNSKFQYSFHGLRVLRPTLDTGFAPLLLLSSFFSTFFLSPSPRSLVFGPPLPVSPSSHPSLILPCRLHPPRCKLTFAVYLPWGLFCAYSIGCASIKRRTSARISSFIASKVKKAIPLAPAEMAVPMASVKVGFPSLPPL